MLVCIYVYVSVCVYMSMYVCAYECICICICVHMCVLICICEYICVYERVCDCVSMWCVCSCVYAWFTPCVLSSDGKCHIPLAAAGQGPQQVKGRSRTRAAAGQGLQPCSAGGGWDEGGDTNAGSEERRAFFTERGRRAGSAQQP